jgi:CRISPR/Cas system-associated exonuclease Cas4 (RecB family)
VVARSLGVDLEVPRDEIVAFTAPDGKSWNLRLLVAAEPGPIEKMGTVQASAISVVLLPPPVVTGQHDTSATVTQLRAFANCPREYYLRYYLGLEGQVPIPEVPHEAPRVVRTLSADELGNQVHKLLNGEVVPNAHPEALRMEGIFRQSALGQRAARATRVEREFDFLVAIEDLVVHGQVDLWFEEGGELVIVDYKTDAVTALAVEQAAGRPATRAWLHFLRPNTAIPVDLTPSLLDSPEQVIRDFQEAQSKMEFPLNESERCRRCPFVNGLCPATLADIPKRRR